MMRRASMFLALLIGVCVVAPVITSVAVATPAFAGGPEINGAGSSYAALAIAQWVTEIQSLDGDQVNYSDSSSVIGLNEFAQEQVLFGASEIGYSTGQANYTPPSNFPYQYLPDVAGATCLDFNLASPITGAPITSLDLTTAMTMGIFTGAITTWGGLTAGGLNPELQGDSTPIQVAFRTDASGENYILSDYLNTLDPSAWNAYTSALNFPSGPQAIWPFPQGGGSHAGYNFSSWSGQSGSDDASNYVYQNQGSITYVETAYAKAHQDPCAAVQNLPGGAFVQPSALADAEALLQAKLLPDLEQLLSGVFEDTNPKAYPISAYSYLITPEGQTNAAQGAVLGQFIEFLACQGQVSAENLGYSPLPPNLVNDDFAGIKRINGAAAPPPSINATTCNDPYVKLFGPGGPPTTTVTSPSGPQTTTPGGSQTTSNNSTNPNNTNPTTGPNSTNPSGGKGNGKTVSTVPGSKKATGPQGDNQNGLTTSGTLPAKISTNPAAQDPSVGLVLYGTAGHMLGLPSPYGEMLLITLGFLLLVAIPPTIAWVRRRRQLGEAR